MTNDFEHYDDDVCNSIFAENSKRGIMLCGYELGGNSTDSSCMNQKKICTFADKFHRYGDEAKIWPYDNRIKKWFQWWGHPLNEDNPGPFERSILQVNWMNTQHRSLDEYKKEYKEKHGKSPSCRNLLTDDINLNNFFRLLEKYRPRVIIFFGIEMFRCLKDDTLVKKKFIDLMGEKDVNTVYKKYKTKSGHNRYAGFMSFENCEVIGLPHGGKLAHIIDESYFEPIKEMIREKISNNDMLSKEV